METYLSFLSHLSRQGVGYFWVKLPDGTKKTIWFERGKIPDLPPHGDVYFGVNPAKARRGGAQRARLEDVAALNCFFAEFDAKQWAGGKEAIMLHIDKLPLQPSVIVDSGGGFHCYWLLDDPRPVVDRKEHAHLKDIQYRWVELVQGDLDSKDLARVLRVPGTYNYKYDPPREVLFIRSAFEQVYYLEDFVALLPTPSPANVPSNSAGGEKPGGQQLQGNPYRWLEEALGRGEGRNATGFWLACQLRDDGVSISLAEEVIRSYQARVTNSSDPYTLKEALDSLKSAYKSPRREPAKNLNRPASATRTNGNGHHPDPAILATPPEESPALEGSTTEKPSTSSTAKDDDADQIDDSSLPKLEYLPIPEIRQGLELQEVGDADLLTRLFKGKIVFDHSASKWHLWQGHYWEEDRTGYVYQLIARRVAPQYLHAAADLRAKGLDKVSDELVKRGAALRNKKRMDNVLYLAARHPEMAITGDEWDSNPWVLGCPNGVIDLKTGDLRPGSPKDFIRSHTKIEWESSTARCPSWIKFLTEVMGGDFEMVSYLQRLFGYGITGLSVEHVFPILWGADGRNGKGTMLQTLADVLGRSIAAPTDAESLMASKNSGNAAQPFLYDLRGMRLVWASETERGHRIDESLVKRLTGGDTIKVRTLYSQPIQFDPTHLIVMLTNYRPHINANGQAIWDRVKLIEFSQRFVDNPQASNEHPKDIYLKDKLLSEAPGILAWLVLGCLEWQEIGLAAPEKVDLATNAYREEEDITGMFIGDRCDVGKTESVKASQLYAAYSTWCKDSGFSAMSLSTFGQELCKKFDRKRTNSGFVYHGIGLRDPIQAQKGIPF